ncbi:MAG: ATP-binding protein [Polyangiaceae bacterium]
MTLSSASGAPIARLLDLPILEDLFDSLPVGVVVLDQQGKVVVYNTAEEKLAGRPRSRVLGRDFFGTVAPCMDVRELGGAFRERIGRQRVDVNIEFSFPFPFLDQPRDVRVRMQSFEARGAPYGLLMVEDVSRERSIDRMRETLQSLLVHDLKNPLAVVVASLGFLGAEHTNAAHPDVAEAIADGLTAAARLQSMLLNLLDIHRLETSSFPLRKVDCDVGALLGSASKAYRGLARASGAELLLDLPAAPMRACLDEGVVRRAIDNLVENAFRHARRVVLRAAHEGGAAVIEVADDGPGVPVAVRESIFEKFAQVVGDGGVQTDLNRGLGLTFVRLALRAHGGNATVHCPDRGGSVFRLEIPTPQVIAQPAS